jgi:hypothetical protein
MSRPGSHPRRHCSLLLAESPSQALKNATSSAFFTHAIYAPLAPTIRARGTLAVPRVRGAFGQKNPTADAEKHRRMDRLLFLRVPVLLRGRRRFSGSARSGAQRSGGMRRRPGNERLPKAAFLSACEGASTRERKRARSGRRGCERGPDGAAP